MERPSRVQQLAAAVRRLRGRRLERVALGVEHVCAARAESVQSAAEGDSGKGQAYIRRG